MTVRRTVTAAVAIVAAVAGGQVVRTGAQAATDPQDRGLVRVRADATTGVRLERTATGSIGFIGTPAGASMDNPGVSATSTVRQAAGAHLLRYGAALGLAADSEMSLTDTTRSVSGQDLVRFQQHVDAAPVIGAQVVVSLRPDREVGSILSTVSDVQHVPGPTVLETSARLTAERAAERSSGSTGLEVTSQGRAIWDPAVFGEPAVGQAQGVWRFEASDGGAVRRLVLVDDTSGRVIVDLDQVAHLDRVVCDRNNVRGAVAPCGSVFARAEGQAATGVADVDAAYDHAGSVATAYSEIAGIDLTDMLGIDVGGTKRLASTVRFCHSLASQGSCPYANAFWNGSQMFYGNTFAVADDVVGHEMTHGVIDHYSELFYWGQSGAINESIADIMGEVVDHRAGLDAGDASWLLAEDLPTGALRTMADPTARNDADRMTSPLWVPDTVSYGDSGGVHSNSGVGNKTAYLISQGGSFNGRTMTGIDGSDTGLTKTGRLYVDAITRLTSGSDYADLAAVLEQSCADFVASGTGGFTRADCAQIATAVLATELRTTPTRAPQPPDAVPSCPTGTTPRELFSSETGSPTTKMASSAGRMWAYGVDPDWGSNATSGRDSWFGRDPDPASGDPASASLTTTAPISLPPAQTSFLAFQQWRLFEWYATGPPRHVDGGTVEVDSGAGPVDAATLPWTNGPQQTLSARSSTSPNQWAGRTAFAGDSLGWTRSQVDLTAFAGSAIRPSFTTRGDAAGALLGWWLDDIVVITCDPESPPTPPLPPAPPAAPPPAPPPAPAPLPPAPSAPPPAANATPPVPPVPPAAARDRSTTRLTVRVGTRVRLLARVRAGGSRARGRVSFRVDGRVLSRTVTLRKGRAFARLTGRQLRRLGAGPHTVRATYRGSTTATRSTARTRFRLR